MKNRISENQGIRVSDGLNKKRLNRRLVLAWIIALGLVAFGVLANWYMVYILAAQPVTAKETINPYQQLYEEMLYPSVRITTDDGIGSGVIIRVDEFTGSRVHESTNELFILTAAHVVGDEALVSVELFGSTESLPAFVVATDTGKDLALLRFASGVPRHASFCIAKLAPRNYVPYIFTPVWVVGCSLGYSPRPTEGCITSLCALGASAVQYWEMNAPIWPGNSGGGVFLKDSHELIGIAVWVKVYRGQLVSTMAGVVPLQTIYEFLDNVSCVMRHELCVPTQDLPDGKAGARPQTQDASRR